MRLPIFGLNNKPEINAKSIDILNGFSNEAKRSLDQGYNSSVWFNLEMFANFANSSGLSGSNQVRAKIQAINGYLDEKVRYYEAQNIGYSARQIRNLKERFEQKLREVA